MIAAQTEILDPLLNEYEAATALGLKVATVRRWRWSGRGPNFLKIGGAVRYEPSEIIAFKKAGRRTSTSNNGEIITD